MPMASKVPLGDRLRPIQLRDSLTSSCASLRAPARTSISTGAAAGSW